MPEILSGWFRASVSVIMPPSEWPTTSGFSSPSLSMNLAISAACSGSRALAPGARVDQPAPGRSSAISR